MENSVHVLGPEASVSNYHLNSQYLTIKKLLLTQEVILSSFEGGDIQSIFSQMMQTDPSTFLSFLKEHKPSTQIDTLTFVNEFYKSLTDELGKLFQGSLDVQLKDYNFVSSVSNTKFTVTLRADSLSFSKFFIEKGELLTVIKELMKLYLDSSANMFRLSRLKNFQLEIFESEEIYKHVYLKKEGNSFALNSYFGFPLETPFDMQVGAENYLSIGEEFTHYENAQDEMRFREHNHLVNKEIHKQDKILSNDDLILINKHTKDISDVFLEIILTKKGQLRIVHVSVCESGIGTPKENGYFIYESSASHTQVSLLTLRDELEGEYPNPKYLLIRNAGEIKELFSSIHLLHLVEGIVFTFPFYHPLLDTLGRCNNLDILFSKQAIAKKNLSTHFSRSDLSFDIGDEGIVMNPFSSIEEEEKKRQEEVKKTLDFDLDIPTEKPPVNDTTHIQSIAQGIISSPNASTSKQASMNWPETPSLSSLSGGGSSGGKKSAISMLADSVIGNNMQPEKQEMPQEEIVAPIETPAPVSDIASSSFVMQDVSASDLTPVQENPPCILVTSPGILNSDACLVDAQSIAAAQDREKYFISTQGEMFPGTKTLLPISMKDHAPNYDFLLVSSLSEFFYLEPHQENVIINLSHIEDHFIPMLLHTAHSSLNSFGLICSKNTVNSLSNYKDKISHIIITDLQSNEEFDMIKNIIV